MEIYSFAFVLLVTVGLVLYYTVLRRCQWLCLLAISLVFFAASGWQGIFFLFFYRSDRLGRRALACPP